MVEVFRVASARRSRRKVSWDLVRSGCVVLVMLYHATFLSVSVHPELGPREFVFPYQVGASLLLVISAYFACATIGRGSVLRYWCARVARLVPPFAGAVLLIFAVSWFATPETWFRPTVGDLLANLAMLWHWDPVDFPFIDASHWTIPLQLMGFTAVALLYRSAWGHRWRLRTVLWVAVLLPIAQWPLRVALAPDWYRTVADGLGLHRWHLFVAGAAIWLWSNRRMPTRQFTALLAVCMAAQLLHTAFVTPDGLVPDWGSAIGVWIGLAVVALTARGPDWDGVLPAWTHRPIRWFAGISYGVFLTHQTLGFLVIDWLHDAGAPTLVQTAGLLVTGTAVGWLLTRVVERPAHTFLMNSYDRWQARRSRTGNPVAPLHRIARHRDTRTERIEDNQPDAPARHAS